MMKDQCLNSSPSSNEKIFNQFERMLASPDFRASPQQIAFLEFVVNLTLAGNADQIKGYTVATEVFGRGPDFDQSIDPVVSIQASRLRRAMELYYLTTGKNDPIRIEIPKGTYVPIFSEQFPSDQHLAGEQVEPISGAETWPTILVRPPTNLTNNPEDNYLSIGLTTELAHALGHYQEIRVLEDLQPDPESALLKTDIDFIIDGNVRRDSAVVKVTVRLCDAKDSMQIWSGNYQRELEAAQLIAFQEEVAAEVAVCVAGDNAVIAKHFAGESRNKTARELSTFEAMVRFWESDTLLTPQSMVHAIRALEYAVASEPDYGQTWSMFAAQYADNYGLEIINFSTPLEKAAAFARRGVSLDPTNRRVRMILGYIRLMQNKLEAARHEAETAYHLCPNSLMSLDAIGWLMALAGEWERGVDWTKKAIKLNPYYRPRNRHALCINWFRLGEYEKAYEETLHFMMPNLFWEPLMKASTLGHLGRIEEGQACVQALLALKPNFEQRGRILIGRYIKFKDISDRIIEGLGKIGMSIE